MAELPDVDIDRTSPIPFYFQLTEILEQEITQGRWETGERMASEAELCEHFDLSRTTVRQALASLEQEGLISRRKGKGSYVTESQRRTWLLQSVEGFFADETGRSGHTVSSSILRLEVSALPLWAADALGLAPGAKGVTIERLRSVDGRVAMYVANHLPIDYADAVLSMTDPNESLYSRLRRLTGVKVAGASRVVEATAVGERMGALLELPASAPVIAVRSVSWGRQQQAFDCYGAWLRTDRLAIGVDVGAIPRSATRPARTDAPLEGAGARVGARRQARSGSDATPSAGLPRRGPRWHLASSDQTSVDNGRGAGFDTSSGRAGPD